MLGPRTRALTFQGFSARHLATDCLMKGSLFNLVCLRVASLTFLVGLGCANSQRHSPETDWLKASLLNLVSLRAPPLSFSVGPGCPDFQGHPAENALED